MDVSSIVGSISGVRHILDVVRLIQDQKIATEINSAVADIQGKLLDIQQQAHALQDENAGLKNEIRRMKAANELGSRV